MLSHNETGGFCTHLRLMYAESLRAILRSRMPDADIFEDAGALCLANNLRR